MKTCLRKLPMEKFTGRYSFRQGNKPDALPDTTIAARGVHHGSGDRHNVHDGRFCKPAGRGLSGWHSCSGEATGSVRKCAGDMTLFKFFPGTDVNDGQVFMFPDHFHRFRRRQGAGVRVSIRCGVGIACLHAQGQRQKKETEEDLKPLPDRIRFHGRFGHGRKLP